VISLTKELHKTDHAKRDIGNFPDAMELYKTDCAKRNVGHFPDAKELYKTDRAKRDIGDAKERIKRHVGHFGARNKRDVYNGDDVPPYDLFYNERDRRQTDRRFDPFLFGSSDRFSHGFGKRRIAHGAAVASVGSSCSI